MNVDISNLDSWNFDPFQNFGLGNMEAPSGVGEEKREWPEDDNVEKIVSAKLPEDFLSNADDKCMIDAFIFNNFHLEPVIDFESDVSASKLVGEASGSVENDEPSGSEMSSDFDEASGSELNPIVIEADSREVFFNT